jgi:hypothetical protein
MNAMGSGVAKALYTKYPLVKVSYHKFCANKLPNQLLGTIDIVPVEQIMGRTSKYVINCFSQLTYGNNGKQHTNYEAIESCFILVNKMFPDKRIAIPYFYGCGLGGGDWTVVSNLIDKHFGVRVTLYKI